MLDPDRLESLFDAMLQALEGDWLLVGGALTALWLSDRRVTEDIDMVGLEGTQEERIRLMQFADDQGLPVETVNSAVDFYLRKIDGWREELEIFRESERVRIFRPNPTLFLLLKIGRLSEQDLDDCLALLDRVEKDGLELDRDRVAQALEARVAIMGSGAANRAKRLASQLGGGSGVTVKLSEIVDALEMQMDEAWHVLDRSTGEIRLVTQEDLYLAEDDEPLEDFPEWQRKAVEFARKYEAEYDRFVKLPDKFEIHEYRALEDFAFDHADPKISETLQRAIRGRGAFRRFKDAVFDLDIQDEWHEYRQEFLERIARDWCEDNEIAYREAKTGP